MNELVNQIAQGVERPANILWMLGAILLMLLIGTVVRLARFYFLKVAPEERRARIGSLVTWWVLFLVIALAVILGRAVAVVLFAVISWLGLREFRLLARERIFALRLWWRLAYLAVPVHYLFILLEGAQPYWTTTLVWVFFILMVRLVVTGQTKGFLETAGITFLGLMMIVFLLSHAVLVLWLPERINPTAGSIGLFLYLVLLTETNDIAQALWGRQFGRYKITPTVSPNKTWEGFLLGVATTVLLALALAPVLTPFTDRPFFVDSVEVHLPYVPALVVGLLIAVSGFFGDITMSAAKRDAGVKDTGSLLPGQGGVLDRIDSLTFTAPVFFYFTLALYS